MELASDIERLVAISKMNLADIAESEIRYLYKAIFGQEFKVNCGQCIDDAYYKLVRHGRKNNMTKPQGKYRFTKEWEKKKVVVTIGGTSHVITAENLSTATAEAILSSGQYRKGIVELNPDYKGEDAVKKNSLAQTPKPEPISSTSTEAPEDGKKSKENVSELVSNTTESQPLTGQKKKRGGK